MNELTERNPFLMEAIEWYPEIWDIISKGRKCAICGKSFLGIWIECVEFVSPSEVNGVFLCEYEHETSSYSLIISKSSNSN